MGALIAIGCRKVPARPWQLMASLWAEWDSQGSPASNSCKHLVEQLLRLARQGQKRRTEVDEIQVFLYAVRGSSDHTARRLQGSLGRGVASHKPWHCGLGGSVPSFTPSSGRERISCPVGGLILQSRRTRNRNVPNCARDSTVHHRSGEEVSRFVVCL